MAVVLFWFENREAQEVKRSGWMPTIERPIHTDEENTFKLIGAISVFAMQTRNVACHELTSRGLEKLLSLHRRAGRSLIAQSDRFVMKLSIRSREASRRLGVPQKSAAYALTRLASR